MIATSLVTFGGRVAKLKIAIAYLPGEEQKAAAIESFIKELSPGVKVRKSDRHAPYMHIYLSTKKPENRCGSMEMP